MHLTRQALCRRATDRLALTQPGHGIMRRSGEAMSFLLQKGSSSVADKNRMASKESFYYI